MSEGVYSDTDVDLMKYKLTIVQHVFVFALSYSGLSNGYGSNSPLTPSARISALNIVSDLLRKVGVSHSLSLSPHHKLHVESPCIFTGMEIIVGFFVVVVHVSPLQALESKLAACRNFAKDQRARKAYALDNGNVLNANTANYSQSLHTSYFDKA